MKERQKQMSVIKDRQFGSLFFLKNIFVPAYQMALIAHLQINHILPLNPTLFSMPGIKKEHGHHKYNKINQQQKFHLLSLLYKKHLSLRQAAHQAKINYLTAKTIVFFHKKDHRSYQFDLQIPSETLPSKQMASYSTLIKKHHLVDRNLILRSQVQVISSVGSVPIKEHISQSETDILNDELQQIKFEKMEVQEPLGDNRLFMGSIKSRQQATLNSPFKVSSGLEMGAELREHFRSVANHLIFELQQIKRAIPSKGSLASN